MCKLSLFYSDLSKFLTYLSFYSAEVTPPPTPSAFKATSGKKRAKDVKMEDEVM